jgi:hypothetical protein
MELKYLINCIVVCVKFGREFTLSLFMGVNSFKKSFCFVMKQRSEFFLHFYLHSFFRMFSYKIFYPKSSFNLKDKIKKISYDMPVAA